MTDKPWPKEWCEPINLKEIAAMKQPTFIPISINTQPMGKSRANIAYIKFCLKQNLKLLIGTTRQKEMIEMLREYFPTALFVIREYGVEIKIRNREELEL